MILLDFCASSISNFLKKLSSYQSLKIDNKMSYYNYFIVLLSTLAPICALISAKDGYGNSVDWWFVLKLPQQVFDDVAYTEEHCRCNHPICNFKNKNDVGSGLCFLYADSNNPELKFYSDLGYDCLGQGSKDPVSQTLSQLTSTEQNMNSTYWGYFNDQFYGLHGEKNSKSYQCSGSDTLNAHSKGSFQYDEVNGGFYLQSSIPNFPNPGDTFVPLGCQSENNVMFSQHVFAMSLNTSEMERLGEALQSATLCSTNFYTSKNATFGSSLTSKLLQDSKESSMYRSFVQPYSGSEQRDIRPQSTHIQIRTLFQSIPIDVIVKSKNTLMHPWALVASKLQTDISVASWMDNSYGIPSICSSDEYFFTNHSFCLLDLSGNETLLSPSGNPLYNIENLIEAKFNETIQWHLFGGEGKGRNHAKWAVETPRKPSRTNRIIFGDMNQQGFPCSKDCSGSQLGRGGTFFSLDNKELWHYMTFKLITQVCSCGVREDSEEGFVENRMCGRGCQNRLQHTTDILLPKVSEKSDTFWRSFNRHEHDIKRQDSALSMSKN